jgi:hypothetical protein
MDVILQELIAARDPSRVRRNDGPTRRRNVA